MPLTLAGAGLLLACASAASAQHAPSASAPRAASPSTHDAPATFAVPAWAFPTSVAPPATPFDSVVRLSVPGSTRTHTMAEVKNPFDAIDWFPDSHPAMPAPVRYGRPPAARACAFCHLPDGAGRPENATLAGLPAEYIARQVVAFREGTRLSANPAASTNSMHGVAKAVTDSEVAVAAQYFASLPAARRSHVIETARVPKTRIEIMLYALEPRGTEPIAGRLIEAPESFERHELRDARVPYTTWVPIGSLARGKRLVTQGPAGPTTACTTCHGPALRGLGAAPPIAGRAPSNILRQLMNFRAGARHEDGSALMAPVVGALSAADMVALAAYVGSQRP